MQRKLLLVIVLCLMAAMVLPVSADQADDAKNLVERALAMIKDQGKDVTLKAINDPKGPFVKGELYVFALTMGNVLVGQPHEPGLRRMNLTNTRDGNGQFFIQKFKEVVENQGSGWVDYTWAKPGQSIAGPKKAFVQKVPGEELYLGAGFYLAQTAK
jgi:cytochrome c